MNAHVSQSDLNTIAPLDVLYQHGFNPRQSHDAEDIAALAHSIAVNGLLQNLSGFRDPAQQSQAAVGIVAGGRRLAALNYLRDHPEEFEDTILIDFEAIPVVVTTDAALARSWAGTEAATQRPLHPADEIKAYATMADAGSAPEQIARAFGCTVRHVRKRLKLAALPAPALDALRANKITLDVAAILTMANSEEQFGEVLTMALEQDHHPRYLRDQITRGSIPSTDRRAKFVGLELYQMEGGTVEEDLFAERSMLHDEALLDRLFNEKLQTAAARVKGDGGYAEVKTTHEVHIPYNLTENMRRAERVPVDLPEADQADLDALLEEGQQRELTDDEFARLDALEERQEGDFTAEDIAAATAFVYVDRMGDLITSAPYLPRNTKGPASGANDTASRVPDKPPLTQTGCEDLHKIEAIALQTKLLGETELVLDLLALQLSQGWPGYASPFNIAPHRTAITPGSDEETRIDARLTDDTTPETETLEEFRAHGKKHRNKVLIEALVRAMNLPHHTPTIAAVMRDLGVSPRDVWTPTAANHFKACRPEVLDSIWRDLSGTADRDDDADMKAFQKLTKGKKADELEALFNDAGFQEARGLSRAQVAAIDAWLPAELVREEK
ncbi:ParB/Srx family N-terminal domain-containing protein [uncultured Sulfitobacter sp.]|uniref:ParB/RepB/Spo0J family partition protein n=1 Tax=uncultured Sulfitobacter sp. TaxID=191468 RepID=UPI0026378C8F|nr:ParB/Srx family N-terminal domain-containing protein [uncultured Sulfitobacter sp.]